MQPWKVYDCRRQIDKVLRGPGIPTRNRSLVVLAIALGIAASLLVPVSSFAAEPTDTEGLKTQAYEAFRQNRLADAATAFAKYLNANPQDAAAALDYAAALSQLNRAEEAAQVLESVHQRYPENQTAYFKLGQVYVQLKRYSAAEKVFQDLAKSNNQDLAAAATEALRNVQAEISRETRAQLEKRVYELASQFKYREELDTIAALEKFGPLAYNMEMQRLYAMQAVGEYAPALKRADKLTETHSQATDLALLRADLLAQLGRRPEAEAIWRRVEMENAGSSAAQIASERLKGGGGRPEEDLIYSLARQHKYQEVVAAIDKLEEQGKMSWQMELQRLYAWEGLGQTQRAMEKLDALAKTHPGSNELALLRADLLMRRHEWKNAAGALKAIKENNPNTPVAQQAEERLQSIPPIYNLDKWYWGEAYLSGDYLGRFGAIVGSGFIRHGFYVQNLRWLQPYLETRFTVDTRSGIGQERTLIADNFVAFSGGVRAQLLPEEYLFCYVSGGINKDLLDRRDNGDWAGDYQAGIYGFKSWGPGTVLLSRGPGEVIQATGNLPATSVPTGSAKLQTENPDRLVFWRGDWFTDAGADFSYYHRYSSWIGYGQAHEGFRLFQVGPHAAVDAYAVENVSWDVRGNYFDNLGEIGPGARILWVPHKHWEVVLRTEYLNGFYFGRNELHNRGGAGSHYEDIRAALSVGVRW